MIDKVIKRMMVCLSANETQFIVFISGLLFLGYPFIGIASQPIYILGIPVIFLYLLLGWIAYIFIVSLIVKAIDKDDSKGVGD